MEKTREKSDRELIRAYMDGDESEFERLLDRHKAKIYRTIRLQVKDAHLAEDIFQETFVKVIKMLRSGQYNEEGKFLPWVVRIARNIVMDHFRRKKRSPPLVDGEGYDIFSILDVSEESRESEMRHHQRDVDLRKIVQMLPDEQKEILIMRLFCDMSFREIAEITDVSINTALGRMRYAIKNMRKMIEEHHVVLDVD